MQALARREGDAAGLAHREAGRAEQFAQFVRGDEILPVMGPFGDRAQRFRCASAIRALPAALILRRFVAGAALVCISADLMVAPPPRLCRTSAIWAASVSRRRSRP